MDTFTCRRVGADGEKGCERKKSRRTCKCLINQLLRPSPSNRWRAFDTKPGYCATACTWQSTRQAARKRIPIPTPVPIPVCGTQKKVIPTELNVTLFYTYRMQEIAHINRIEFICKPISKHSYLSAIHRAKVMPSCALCTQHFHPISISISASNSPFPFPFAVWLAAKCVNFFSLQ